MTRAKTTPPQKPRTATEFLTRGKTTNIQSLIARTGPWLVALAPAWFVFDVLATRFAVPAVVAALVAAGVELTGIASYHTFTRLYSWNRRKRQTDPAAPLWMSILAVGGYVIAGIILTAALKHDWSLGLFFLLAAVGYTVIALNIDQDEREKAVAQARAEAKEVRERRRTSGKRPPERLADKPKPFEHSPEFDELLATIHERSQGQQFGPADVQKWTGRKRTTAYAVLKYGEQSGVIQRVGRGLYVYRNGVEADD